MEGPGYAQPALRAANDRATRARAIPMATGCRGVILAHLSTAPSPYPQNIRAYPHRVLPRLSVVPGKERISRGELMSEKDQRQVHHSCHVAASCRGRYSTRLVEHGADGAD